MELKKYICIKLKMLLYYFLGVTSFLGLFHRREADVLSWAPSGNCICLNPLEPTPCQRKKYINKRKSCRKEKK